jgi:hypothetical protein
MLPAEPTAMCLTVVTKVVNKHRIDGYKRPYSPQISGIDGVCVFLMQWEKTKKP